MPKPKRTLHLAAYDIADPDRLVQLLSLIKAHATGGQKSVFECYLTPAERKSLLQDVAEMIDEAEDRFLLMRIDPRSFVAVAAAAVKPEDPVFYYVG